MNLKRMKAERNFVEIEVHQASKNFSDLSCEPLREFASSAVDITENTPDFVFCEVFLKDMFPAEPLSSTSCFVKIQFNEGSDMHNGS